MTKGLVRYQQSRTFHFLTFSCYRRLPLLGKAAACSVFKRELEVVRRRFEFVVAGYVLMPEHVHLLSGDRHLGSHTPRPTSRRSCRVPLCRKLPPASAQSSHEFAYRQKIPGTTARNLSGPCAQAPPSPLLYFFQTMKSCR